MPGIFDLMQDMDDQEIRREGFIRSPLNYMGSKFESLEQILPLIPHEDVFVDGFGGSGVVMLNRSPSKLDVFNDRHSGITSFFQACITDPDRLTQTIQLMPHSREMFSWCKDNVLKAQDDMILRGAMWYYIAKCSFAGKCKYFGRALNPVAAVYSGLFSCLDVLPTIRDRFQKVQVENLDWREIFKDYDSHNTVFYLDPPYYGAGIYEYNMTKADHYSLCAKIFALKGFVAVSGYSNEAYDQFDWDAVHEFDIRNACVAQAFNENNNLKGVTMDRNGIRKECLWIKEAN